MIVNWNNSQKKEIENLPNSLTRFYCSCNQISKIENLPDSLNLFDCSGNQISQIENLPDSLIVFKCGRNQISKIENLPLGLQEIQFDIENVSYVDNVPIAFFADSENRFSLKKYQIIRRLIKRVKRMYKRKKEAVTIIQRGCHNWLWNPGTGISYRLAWKDINKNCI